MPLPRRSLRSLGGRLRARDGIAAALGLLLLAGASVTGSVAAWSARDDQSGSSFSATSLEVWDDQGGHAGWVNGSGSAVSGTSLWTVTDLTPGSGPYTRCVGIGSTGGSALTLRADVLSATGGLDGQLTVTTATYATGGTVPASGGGSCAGYPSGASSLPAQGQTLAAWSASAPASLPAAPAAWFRFTLAGLPGGASCASLCGRSLTFRLTWTLSA